MAITASDVLDIMDTNLGTSDITPLLTAAEQILVEWVDGKGVGSTTRDELKKFLTAHIARSTKEKAAAKQSVGPESVTYEGDTGLHLEATHYGQTVKMLDPTGTLQSLGQQKRKAIFQSLDPNFVDPD